MDASFLARLVGALLYFTNATACALLVEAGRFGMAVLSALTCLFITAVIASGEL